MQPILSKWAMGVEEMDRREEVLVVVMALEIVLEVMMDREKVIDEIMMVILMVTHDLRCYREVDGPGRC